MPPMVPFQYTRNYRKVAIPSLIPNAGMDMVFHLQADRIQKMRAKMKDDNHKLQKMLGLPHTSGRQKIKSR